MNNEIKYMNELIDEMRKMQAKLDEALLIKGRSLGKIDKYTTPRVKMALIDELGELTHELKGDWCWWKINQKPVDQKKVLEELVDVWHFALSIMNITENCYPVDSIQRGIRNAELYDLDLLIENVIVSSGSRSCMTALTYKLGFTIYDIYEEYKRKNAINWERYKGGY